MWHLRIERPAENCAVHADSDALELVDTILPHIIQMLGSCKVSVYGRDNMMELLIKFVTRKDGIGWSKKFMEAGGCCSLLLLCLACWDVIAVCITLVNINTFSYMDKLVSEKTYLCVECDIKLLPIYVLTTNLLLEG